MTIVLAAAAAALFGCGTYMLLQRQLTRIVIGLGMLAHGANLIIIMSRGGRAAPTFIGSADEASMLDPLPQAFILTAIVIAFGTTSFLLALAYRSWVITHDDEVEDDVEDRLILLRTTSEDVVDALAAAEAEEEWRGNGEDAEDGEGATVRPREPGDQGVHREPDSSRLPGGVGRPGDDAGPPGSEELTR